MVTSLHAQYPGFVPHHDAGGRDDANSIVAHPLLIPIFLLSPFEN
ncbi:hypothetical protein [Pedobacter sp. SYSU D00535]|nr:hypothetical protein [Pedobacter sp. SYSU D00535]